MKKLPILLAIFVMQGCQTTSKMDEIIDVKKPDMKGLSRKEFIAAGYNKAYGLCTDYFDALIKAKNDTTFYSESITAAGTAATTIMGLAKAYSPAVGIVSAGFGVINNALFSYNKDELITPYPDETKGLILKALDEFSNANPPIETDTDGEAVTRVMKYAEMCTYSGISRFAKVTIAKGTPSCRDEMNNVIPCQAAAANNGVSPEVAAIKSTSISLGVSPTTTNAIVEAVTDTKSSNPTTIGKVATDAARKNGVSNQNAVAIGASATGAVSSNNATDAASIAIQTITASPSVTNAAVQAVTDSKSSNPETIGKEARDAAIENGASTQNAAVIGASATGAAVGANTSDNQKDGTNQKIITISP